MKCGDQLNGIDSISKHFKIGKGDGLTQPSRPAYPERNEYPVGLHPSVEVMRPETSRRLEAELSRIQAEKNRNK